MHWVVATFLVALSLSCYTDAAWVRVIQSVPELKMVNAYIEEVRLFENLTFTQIPPYFYVPDGMQTFWFDLTPLSNFDISQVGNTSFLETMSTFNIGNDQDGRYGRQFNPNVYRNFSSGQQLPYIPFSAPLFAEASYTLVITGTLVNFGISLNLFTDSISAVTGICTMSSSSVIINNNNNAGSVTNSHSNQGNMTGSSQLVITETGLVSTLTSKAGFIRLINLVPNAQSAVLIINGKPVTTTEEVDFLGTSKYIDMSTLGVTFGTIRSLQVQIEGQSTLISAQSVNFTQRDTNNLWTVFLFPAPYQSTSGPQLISHDDFVDKTQNVLVRFVHAWPELPAFDLYVDGKPMMKNISFSTVTPYFMTSRGIHKFKIVGSGEKKELYNISHFSNWKSADGDLFRFMEFVAWNQTYTIAMIRPMLRSELGYAFAKNNYLYGPNHLTAHKFLVDILLNQLTGSSSALRLVHLAPDAGEIFVELSSTSGGQMQSTVLNYPDATPYLSISGGQYSTNLTVFPKNTTSSASVGGMTAQTSPDMHQMYQMQVPISFQTSAVYSMFIFNEVGYSSDPTQQVIVKPVADFPAAYSHWRAQVLQF